MKTLRLNKSESIAYANGERRFWRELKYTTEHRGPYNPAYVECHKNDPGWAKICPYGTSGDYLWLQEYSQKRSVRILAEHRITAITVEHRDGKWGWVVEVGV